jgi:hypothetical protein
VSLLNTSNGGPWSRPLVEDAGVATRACVGGRATTSELRQGLSELRNWSH